LALLFLGQFLHDVFQLVVATPLRRSFYKALISAGVDGVVEVAQRILNMLRKASHET
jgi:hypothetical protein